MCFTSANLYKSFFPEKARSSRFAIASVGLVAKPVRSREPQRGSLLAALVATEKWTLPALSSHRDLRNPAARSHTLNFCRHSLNLLRVHWSAKHGHGIRNAHSPPLIPANILKKHHVHEPLDTRVRSAARLLQALWREDQDLPIGSYVNEDGKRRKLGSRISEAAGKSRWQFPHARDRLYRPARGWLSRNWRAHRRGAARAETPLDEAHRLY